MVRIICLTSFLPFISVSVFGLHLHVTPRQVIIALSKFIECLALQPNLLSRNQDCARTTAQNQFRTEFMSWLSKYIKPCGIRSPDFRKCALTNGNEAIPHLLNGDKAYGIPPLNPLRLPFVEINSNGMDMNLTNCVYSGAENIKLIDISVSNETQTCEIQLEAPLISAEFDYSVTGRIASLPIGGTGHGKMELVDAIFGYGFDFKLIEKNGKTYILIGKDKITIQPQNMKTDLQNLFDGNKQLGDAVNQFMNENWKEVLTEFEPAMSTVYGTVARKVFEKFLGRIPVEEIFSDW